MFSKTNIIIRIFVIGYLTINALTSCSSDKHEFVYRNRTEAMKDYRCFLKGLSSKSSINKDKLCNAIVQWREMRDSVLLQVVKDTATAEKTQAKRDFFNVDDSISYTLSNLIDASPFTLSDLIYIKEHSSPLKDDADLMRARQAAEGFFYSLDSIGLMKDVSRQIILRDYRRFLQRTITSGINNKTELLSFIRSEDVYFRMFLQHLPEYENEPVRDITRFSEIVCEKIRQSAALDSETKIIFMTMRTNRRLIKNVETCISDIKRGRCKSEITANLYLYMCIQPFVILDDVSVALMTTQQLNTLYQTASNLKSTFHRSKLSKDSLEMLDDKLAKQLLKVYISTINH